MSDKEYLMQKIIDELKRENDSRFKEEFLLSLYNSTQADITRYRDREWLIPGSFVVALISTIGFMVTNENAVRSYPIAFIFLLFCLASANCYYLIYTHRRLVEQKKVRENLYSEIDPRKFFMKAEFPYEIVNHPTKSKYLNVDIIDEGFKSHIVVFIVFGFLAASYGLLVVFRIAFLPMILAFSIV